MRKKTPLKLLFTLAFLMIPIEIVKASIEPLTLEKMLSYSDGCIVGKITSKKGYLANIPTLGQIVITKLTIEGKEILTGKKKSVEVAYLGGSADGVSIQVSNQPPDRETTPGNKVLVFYYYDKVFNANMIIAQLGGIFMIQKGPLGDVVIGKGVGSAVPRNILLNNLENKIKAIKPAKREEKK